MADAGGCDKSGELKLNGELGGDGDAQGASKQLSCFWFPMRGRVLTYIRQMNIERFIGWVGFIGSIG
jgi:hypothetical protein